MNKTRFWTICERYLRMRITDVAYDACCITDWYNETLQPVQTRRHKYLEAYGIRIKVTYYLYDNMPLIGSEPSYTIQILLYNPYNGGSTHVDRYCEHKPSRCNISISDIITELQSQVNDSWFHPKPRIWDYYESTPENEFTCNWGIHGTCSPYDT